MANAHLARYLNDHLAGSVTVLELLPHLAKAHAGTEQERFFTALEADVTADRQELEAVMGRLGISQSHPRQAAAWLAEKITQVKLRLEDRTEGAFYLLESLEVIAIGIEGKRGLWRALAAAAEKVPELQGTDYESLEQRAEKQRSRVEEVRLEAARTAFGGTP